MSMADLIKKHIDDVKSAFGNPECKFDLIVATATAYLQSHDPFALSILQLRIIFQGYSPC